MELLESDKEKKTYETPKITAVTFKVQNCLTSRGGNNDDWWGGNNWGDDGWGNDRGHDRGQPGGDN